jgi:hypothetical protein
MSRSLVTAYTDLSPGSDMTGILWDLGGGNAAAAIGE